MYIIEVVPFHNIVCVFGCEVACAGSFCKYESRLLAKMIYNGAVGVGGKGADAICASENRWKFLLW